MHLLPTVGGIFQKNHLSAGPMDGASGLQASTEFQCGKFSIVGIAVGDRQVRNYGGMLATKTAGNPERRETGLR